MVPPSHNPFLALPPVYISDFTGFCHAAAFLAGNARSIAAEYSLL